MDVLEDHIDSLVIDRAVGYYDLLAQICQLHFDGLTLAVVYAQLESVRRHSCGDLNILNNLFVVVVVDMKRLAIKYLLIGGELFYALGGAEIAFEIGDILYFSIINTCVFVYQIVNLLQETLIPSEKTLSAFMLYKCVIVYHLLQFIRLFFWKSAQQKIEFVVGNADRRLFFLLVVPFLHANIPLLIKFTDSLFGVQAFKAYFYIFLAIKSEHPTHTIFISLFAKIGVVQMGKNRLKKSRSQNKVLHQKRMADKESQSDQNSRSGSQRSHSAKRKQKLIGKGGPKKIKRQSSSEEASDESMKEYQSRTNSEQSSISQSRSSFEQSDYSNPDDKEDEKEYKKRQKGFGQYLDVAASQSSGEEESEPDSEALQQHRRQRDLMEKKLLGERGEAARYMDNLIKMKEDDINKHFEQRMRERMQEENSDSQDLMPEGRKDVELFQINCSIGQEEEVVGWILNKKRYSIQFPKLYNCEIISAMAIHKKFPGLVFLEGETIQAVQRSIQGMQHLKIHTLKRMQFEIFSNIFSPIKPKGHEYKVHQYVRIKSGIYREDLGQITKINKKGVVVQVVPRINFSEIKERMRQIDIEYAKLHFKENQIMRFKNIRFRELTDPKGTFEKNRPEKKKLLPLDFQPFSEYAHTKKIKITSEGLLLVNYNFADIQEPKTSFSAMDILMLNPTEDDRHEILKRQRKNIKMGMDFLINETVQIITGQLRGCFGRVQQKLRKVVKIKCLNKQLKGIVVEQIENNVVKLFKQGDQVLVIDGAHKGEVGQIYQNRLHTVKVITSNKQRIKVNKRDVHLKQFTTITFDNDLGIKVDDIVKTRFQLGIACDVKKGYVDFVTPHNQIKRGMNNDLSKITNYHGKAHTRDKHMVQRDCLVQILTGIKKGKIFKIKHIYNNYLFLQDTDQNKLYGNWIERAEDCALHLMVAPKIEARFLEDQGMYRRFFQDRRPNLDPKNPRPLPESDPFKVGKYYRITHGVFKGVRGVIVATFKTHIDVCVFNNKIERIQRHMLKDPSCSQKSRKNSDFDQEQLRRQRGSFLSREMNAD